MFFDVNKPWPTSLWNLRNVKSECSFPDLRGSARSDTQAVRSIWKRVFIVSETRDRMFAQTSGGCGSCKSRMRGVTRKFRETDAQSLNTEHYISRVFPFKVESEMSEKWDPRVKESSFLKEKML